MTRLRHWLADLLVALSRWMLDVAVDRVRPLLTCPHCSTRWRRMHRCALFGGWP